MIYNKCPSGGGGPGEGAGALEMIIKLIGGKNGRVEGMWVEGGRAAA